MVLEHIGEALALSFKFEFNDNADKYRGGRIAVINFTSALFETLNSKE
jgi:hypothetical protein